MKCKICIFTGTRAEYGLLKPLIDKLKVESFVELQLIISGMQLSADVTNRIAEALDNFIRTKRKSYSSEQRQYIEKRLGQVKDSLNYAENRLMSFKEKNRTISQSPALILEQTSLSRGGELLNAVYLELSKQLELAKIDEVKDTPVINLQEAAKDTVIKTWQKREKG